MQKTHITDNIAIECFIVANIWKFFMDIDNFSLFSNSLLGFLMMKFLH